jgi:hypothetical protein
VPLGLDVIGETNAEWLLVEGIRLGGAVEAWNRQCHGDAREIRRGDRIIMINGAEAAESMRQECLNKHLLRMTVLRGVPQSRDQADASLGGVSAGLRAEAEEFIPQVFAASQDSAATAEDR